MKFASRRPLVFSLALATVLAIGVSMLWMLAAGWVASIAHQMFGARGANEQLVFTAGGKPLVQASDYTRNTTVLRTVDGQLVEDVDNIDVQHGSNWLSTPELWYMRRVAQPRISWHQRVTGFVEPGGAPNFWFLVTDAGNPVTAYFEGFDAKTRAKIGYIGLAGYRPDEPPAGERFEIDPRSLSMSGMFAGQYGNQGREPYSYGVSSGQPTTVFMVCMEKLYRVDLRRRTVELVPMDGRVLSIGNVGQPVRVPDQTELLTKRRIAVRMADRILLMDEAGAILRTVPLPEGVQDRMLEVFLPLRDETIVVAMADMRHEITDVYWINSAGQVASRELIRIANGYFTYFEEPMWQVAIGLPAPLVLGVVTLTTPLHGIESGRFDNYSTALAHILRNGWPWLLGVAVLSAVLAVTAYRRQMRYAQSNPGLWALFVFLLGPAGMIGYLVHRIWPAMSRCARCGATVPQDRRECAACAAEFALPARRGVEIFA